MTATRVGPGTTRLALTLGAAMALLLAGCGTTSSEVTTTTSGSSGSNASASSNTPDRRTDSDRGEAEKRARVRLELASAYFGRGQATTALDEVKLALAAKPDLHEGYNLRGLIYASMGEDRLADESFQRALQLAPRDADSLHNYAWYQCQQRRFDEADKLFLQAQAVPQYDGVSRSLFGQGVCQARAGKTAEAERTLSRSYELEPANPATAYNLAEVLLRRGQLERARFYVGRINAVAEQVTAQSLWLAARIEHRAGDGQAAQRWGRMLRDRFPQSTEALQFERGRFDDA